MPEDLHPFRLTHIVGWVESRKSDSKYVDSRIQILCRFRQEQITFERTAGQVVDATADGTDELRDIALHSVETEDRRSLLEELLDRHSHPVRFALAGSAEKCHMCPKRSKGLEVWLTVTLERSHKYHGL